MGDRLRRAPARTGRGFAVHPGRMELELRPPLHVDKGTVVRALAAEHAGRCARRRVFGDDIGDLPAFAAVGNLGAEGEAVGAVRVAAVDDESPAEVAAPADVTVPGASGAVGCCCAAAGRGRRRGGDGRAPTQSGRGRQPRAAASWSAHQSAEVRPATRGPQRGGALRRARRRPSTRRGVQRVGRAVTSKGLTPSAPPPPSGAPPTPRPRGRAPARRRPC